MVIDLADDIEYLDNPDTLTLRIAGQADQPIDYAGSEPISFSDAEPTGGQVLQGDVLWFWPVHYTPTMPPLGSRLIDSDANEWTILSIVKKDHVNTWEAQTRNLKVVYGLYNSVSILHATYTKSSGGEKIPTWTVQKANVAARVQNSQQVAEILEDADWTQDDFRIILQDGIDVEFAISDYRIVDAAGIHYRVMRYEQTDRIDVLPVAICRRILEGSEGTYAMGSSSGVGSSSGNGSSSSGA